VKDTEFLNQGPGFKDCLAFRSCIEMIELYLIVSRYVFVQFSFHSEFLLRGGFVELRFLLSITTIRSRFY